MPITAALRETWEQTVALLSPVTAATFPTQFPRSGRLAPAAAGLAAAHCHYSSLLTLSSSSLCADRFYCCRPSPHVELLRACARACPDCLDAWKFRLRRNPNPVSVGQSRVAPVRPLPVVHSTLPPRLQFSRSRTVVNRNVRPARTHGFFDIFRS